jgi:hypothetical protein
MTTERAPKRAPRLGLTGLEWKLLLATALGASYTAAWLAVAGPAAATPTQPSVSPRRTKAAVFAGARQPSKAQRVRTRSS